MRWHAIKTGLRAGFALPLVGGIVKWHGFRLLREGLHSTNPGKTRKNHHDVLLSNGSIRAFILRTGLK